ncbi:hypothetical protein BB560_000653 [Smittium megazygosporum]|uniref:Uncharacterized protein n=1 Tax=Smittium megazygosporum TaxID=133381 RepID=A0A2T9ZJT9_9FUNG|nr:hypothetical protein BB560_000653 [Smittium megazygosporum]
MSSPLEDEIVSIVDSFLGPVNPNFPLQEEYRRRSLIGLCKNILSSNYGQTNQTEETIFDQIQKSRKLIHIDFSIIQRFFEKDSSARSTLEFKTKMDRIRKASLGYDFSKILQVLFELSNSNLNNAIPNVSRKTLQQSIKDEQLGSKKLMENTAPSPNYHLPKDIKGEYVRKRFIGIDNVDSMFNDDGQGVLLSQLLPKVNDIDEETILKDVLFVIQGIDGKYITWNKISNSISIDTRINISNPTMYILDRLFEVGELNNRITKYINLPETSQSLVRQELNQLSEFISEIEQKQAYSSNPQIPNSYIKLSLRGLYVQIQPQLEKLRTLATMIESFYLEYDENSIESSSGGEMLSKLYIFTKDGNPVVKELANKMLASASLPFNKMLMRWITEGELEDPYKEFFVTDEFENVEPDSLWTSRYNIDVSKIPVYICSDITRKIFLTGKSLSFLRVACNDLDWITLQAPTKDFTQDLGDQVLLKAIVDKVYEKVNIRLLQVLMNDYNLMKHIAAMKKYLLLEQGDFVQCLVESLGSQLDRPASRLIHHNIMTSVESAIRSSNAQFDAFEFTERISVRINAVSSSENSGWSAFPITYHLDSPISYVISDSTMSKYNELTTFLLKLKRIELHLHQLWQHQLSLKSGERYIYLNAIEGSYNKFLKSIYGKDYDYNSSFSLLEVNTPVRNADLEASDTQDVDDTKSEFTKVKPGFDLDEWIAAHENYISEVRRMVMGKRRSYINTVEHILNTINLFCISSDRLYNDILGLSNSQKLSDLQESNRQSQAGSKGGSKENLSDFVDQLNKRNIEAKIFDTNPELEQNKVLNTENEYQGLNKRVVDKVQDTINTFKRDIRNMLKLVEDGTDSIFLKGLAFKKYTSILLAGSYSLICFCIVLSKFSLLLFPPFPLESQYTTNQRAENVPLVLRPPLKILEHSKEILFVSGVKNEYIVLKNELEFEYN